jgi:hypothetical protein
MNKDEDEGLNNKNLKMEKKRAFKMTRRGRKFILLKK